MLVSPLASSTSPATIFIGQEPSCALGGAGTSRRRASRGVDLAADEQRHRGLDVVPDVGVPAGGPRDGAVGLLHGGDRRRGRGDLRRRSSSPAIDGDRRRSRGDSRLAEVEHQALADQRVEHPLGAAGWPAAAS